MMIATTKFLVIITTMMIFIVTSIGIIVNCGRSRRRSSGTIIMLIAAMIRVSNFLVLRSV